MLQAAHAVPQLIIRPTPLNSRLTVCAVSILASAGEHSRNGADDQWLQSRRTGCDEGESDFDGGETEDDGVGGVLWWVAVEFVEEDYTDNPGDDRSSCWVSNDKYYNASGRSYAHNTKRQNAHKHNLLPPWDLEIIHNPRWEQEDQDIGENGYARGASDEVGKVDALCVRILHWIPVCGNRKAVEGC